MLGGLECIGIAGRIGNSDLNKFKAALKDYLPCLEPRFGNELVIFDVETSVAHQVNLKVC